ncbi:MAG: 3-ketoacyl-CoA thiolase [bacterium]|nr:3-ketoacyl-CoA thiolase [bacterium]
MKYLHKPVYATAGYNTIAFGSGRKEFNPKAARPGLEQYIMEAGKGTIAQINDPSNIDEGVISNFMMARFNHQSNRPGFFPMIHPSLKYKPATGVEGACGSGGLGLTLAAKAVLAGVSDVVMALGVEVQNTVKAVYGADFLAGAAHYNSERKEGHAFFFPAQFSNRAGKYFDKFGKEKSREAMALWYEQAIENARKNPKAQEHHNAIKDLFKAGMTPPNPVAFCEHINIFDCSKVSDGASSIIFASEEGLKKLGVSKKDAVEVMGWGQCEDDITTPPPDLTKFNTTEQAANLAYKRAGISVKELGLLEVHDCFTISGLISMEAVGAAKYGESADFVKAGKTRINGELPTNTTGGLIGYGHPVGASGVRQAVDILHQLTGKAGDCQVKFNPARPYGLMVSMGGNDKTVIAMVFKRAD